MDFTRAQVNSVAWSRHVGEHGAVDDEEYARELFRILTRPLDPDEPVDGYGTGADGIDRHDGFGTEVRVVSIDVVPGPYGAQLDVAFRLDAPPGDDVPPDGRLHLPLDREWREAQGYGGPATYAPEVARQTFRAAGRHVARHRRARREAPEPALPDRATQAEWLRDARQRHPEVEIVVTPDEWEQVVASHHGRQEWLDEEVSELAGSCHRDDRFLVFWEGDLERSVRAELPPVHGTLRQLLAMRAAGPPLAGGAWFAYEPTREDKLPG